MDNNRNGLIKIVNRAGRGYGFPAIRAKALLAKPLGSMQRCPSCNGEFPTSSFRSDTFGHEVCGGIADTFGVDIALVHRVDAGKRWQHVPRDQK